MRIDLHTHSDRSDGTDSPRELIENAVVAGLDVVALTDHDSTEGWEEAFGAAEDVDLRLVPGIEMSTQVAGKSVHLLGYLFDPTDVPLVAEMKRVIDGRSSRIPATLQRLRDHGIEITADLVRQHSRNAAALGRPHVADALVELGVVANRDQAFEEWLAPGRPAYVDRYATDLVAAIRLLKAAGGRAVIAHPWSRGSDRVLTPDAFAGLVEAGLDGIEVDHNDHDADQRAALRAIAADHDLIVTGSSDYHGTGKIGFDLGCNTTAPDQLDRLLAQEH